MHALVLYESMFGNTERIARAVEGALGDGASVEVRSIAETTDMPTGIDLLVVGGPTYAHGVEAAMKRFLDRLPDGTLKGVAATAFDTRLNWPKFLSGAASKGIADRLEKKGARIIVDPESFLVEDKDGPLLAGEEDRAAAWARHVVEAYRHQA